MYYVPLVIILILIFLFSGFLYNLAQPLLPFDGLINILLFIFICCKYLFLFFINWEWLLLILHSCTYLTLLHIWGVVFWYRTKCRYFTIKKVNTLKFCLLICHLFKYVDLRMLIKTKMWFIALNDCFPGLVAQLINTQ